MISSNSLAKRRKKEQKQTKEQGKKMYNCLKDNNLNTRKWLPVNEIPKLIKQYDKTNPKQQLCNNLA